MNTLRSLTPHRYRSRHSGATLGSGLSRIVCLVALFVTFAASMRAQYPVTTSSFPDKNFYSVVLKNYSMFNGTYFQTSPVTTMDVKSCNIADLTGIGLFPILQTLDCSNNQLTSVDLSYNAYLTTVTIYNNKLRGTNMDNFISNLFDRSKQPTKGELRIIYNENASTGNQMTTDQVAAAKKKGWTPKQSTNGTTWTDYPGVVLINSTNFPDKNFQAWLKKQTYGQDGVLTDAEIAGVTSINVSYRSISDLTGINYFTALTGLYCYENELTDLDVSKNTRLTTLDCGVNQLTDLNVSGCTALTTLWCNNNQLTDLDVSGCTALTQLDCYQNQLTDLDVSKNTALTKLDCGVNQLTDLDVSKNTALTKLWCKSNQLTDLDVSKNTKLTELYCYENELTNLDVSGCTALTQLDCGDNQLTNLNVSKNTALTTLWCNSNQLTDLDVTKNTALTALYCYCNELTNLDVSGCTALTKLYCYQNQLNAAAVGKLIKSLPKTAEGVLRFINKSETPDGNEITKSQVAAAKAKRWTPYYWNNSNREWLPYEGIDAIAIDETNFPDSKFQAWLKTKTYGQDGVLTDAEIAGVTSINVREKGISDLTGINYFTALTELDCSFNKLTTLDVSKNTALTELGCSYNQLTNLDVSGCTALTELYCYNNQLTNLDVSKNTALTELECSSNQLTNLDVSGCTALTELDCFGNQLTNLDVSKNTALTELVCSNNQLTDLDVSKNTKLTELYCSGNQLSDLDVSKNTALTELQCSYNQLTDLDVSDCTALTELHCGGNQLSDLDVSKNAALTELGCNNNQLHGAAVNKLINSLPETTEAALYFYYNEKPDGNEITTAQVAAAKKEKGWTTYYWNNRIYNWLPYEGISITAGDLNNDSKIDAADVALLISYLTNPEAFEGEELALDVNADGEVDDKDLDELVNNILK